jgi:hypothetical protein
VNAELTYREASTFAAAWYESWAARDAERILGHYHNEVYFVSPSVRLINGDPTGTVRGKRELRDYVRKVIDRFDDLRFTPIALMVGIDSIAMHYVSVRRLLAMEVVTLRRGKILLSYTHYARPEAERAARP